MKRSGCKTVIRLLFVQLILLITVAVYADEVQKKFSKEYDAKGIKELEISNRYGDVEFVNTDNNKISIVVDVQVYHPNNNKAEKLLSLIDVEFSKDDNTIEARTVIDRQFKLNNIGSGRGFSIDYRVEMPGNLNLDVVNRYGTIKAGDLSGHVDIRIKYGSLFITSLTRDNQEPLNSIDAEYLHVADINNAGWLELDMRYVSKLNIGQAQALLINSRYSTNNNIGTVSSVVIDSKYDKYNIENLKNVVAESGYTNYDFGTVAKTLDIETKYGSIKADKILKDFDMVRAYVEYATVRLSFEEDASYRLDADTRYCSLSFDERNADILRRIEDSHSKTVEAIIGNKNTDSKVRIDANYGSVKLY
ncbi:MAG: hypothetical protein K9J25_03835 [Bacteroidales bacterium]|nr:hypothetical protein [Bacteroidales bacterium]